jgi:hypothetical protein
MRTIDGSVQTQLESPGRSDLVLCFLTVTDPARDVPARIVCEENGSISYANGLGINYYLDGDLYYALPYKFSRLSDDDRPARATLTVPTFDRRILLWLQEMQNPARLRFDAYAGSAWGSALDADNARSPIATPKRIYLADLMWLRNVSAGGTEIVCEVGGYDFTQEPLGKRATKDLCPDIYR